MQDAVSLRSTSEGDFMHELATQLWPFPRALTGDGVRKTLAVLSEHLPGMVIHEVPSGTQVLDWIIPDEWNIRDAFVINPDGQRVIDFAHSNVHVVSYSEPVDGFLSLQELQPHLHSDPEHEHAIPYVTSYYHRTWGFCLSQIDRDQLTPGTYHAVIDSSLQPGSLTYGEFVLPGESDEEVFISTYICHPSLANNELSGPVVSTALARWLMGLPARRYTYRFVFVPESIGAITYIAHNLDFLKEHTVAGFNLTCIGDEGDFSYLESRRGGLPIDRIGRRAVMKTSRPVVYSYMSRGSDERHYGAPGVDLPIISLMRTKYGSYPEYHTSADDLTLVTPEGLQGGLDLVRDCVTEFEGSHYYRTKVLGEPQLGRRGLYHTVHARTVADAVLLRTHVLAYADGMHSVDDMAEMFERDAAEVQAVIDELFEHDLLEEVPLQKETMRK